MTFGFSRDDAPKFLKFYKEHGVIKVDPFEVLDQEGVGQLVEIHQLFLLFLGCLFCNVFRL